MANTAGAKAAWQGHRRVHGERGTDVGAGTGEQTFADAAGTAQLANRSPVNDAIHGPVRGTHGLSAGPRTPAERPTHTQPPGSGRLTHPCDSLPERLLHPATAVVTSGQSYRMRQANTRTAGRPTTLPDGSYRSQLDALAVRVIEADLVAIGDGGSRVQDSYRLITTLLDHHRYPAIELLRLYHERWEIELAYLALRHTILDGRVLRSGDQPGLEQEVWALLTLYQLLRLAMTEAVESRPGTDPDRASFSLALQVARDQVTTATGIYPENHTSVSA